MSRKSMLAAGALALGLISVAGMAWSQAAPQQPAARPAPTPPAKPDSVAPTVSVTGGKTAGGIYGDVAIYRGIPFAAPPVGDLRWRAPQPVKPWSNVREGIDFGGTCTTNEDCLYVNVYKPADAKPGQKLPVMVWIYGGAFTGGSSNMYEGPNFAKKGIVYVSINYRLGRTGWFSHPAISKNAPKNETIGNYGLQDQIAALKWVQANVSKFGGDPKHVTIFGESAGAISVNYLMITPSAKPLFMQAISESGFGRHEPAPIKVIEAGADTYFKALGITGDSAETLKKMREVPFAKLQGDRIPLGGAGPINDGKLLTMGTATGFEKGLQAKVPYMIGGNSNEASLFPTANPAARLAEIKAKVPDLGAYQAQGRGDAARTVNLMVTDQYITEPDRVLARAQTKAGQPVYRYYFSYVAPAQRTSLGLSHGGEIGYVFGRQVSNAEDAATSQSANAYWASFAKYGTPGAAGGPAWPKYDLANEAALEFSVAGSRVVPNFEKSRLDWNEKNRDVVINSASAGAGRPVTPDPAAGARR